MTRWLAFPAGGLVLAMAGLVACSSTPPAGSTVYSPPGRAPQKVITSLDRYVAQPDTNYVYHLVNTQKLPGCTAFTIQMTSQSWRSSNEVDQTLWKHWMVVVKPDELKSGHALLFITGGSKSDNPPKGPDEMLARIAVQTHSVVTELHQVPNQPLVFAGETRKRTEDAIIAYTWDKYLRTGDDSWPARLPMTKAAVRAMDTVEDFARSEAFGKVKIEGFVVAGASKRGWTTWTTAAVDKRVIGIIPIVIDLLNLTPSFRHHYQAYGFWAEAVNDYVEAGIMEWMGTAQFNSLMSIVEPYSYLDRFTMPKFLINAADDQFFLPDSSQFYFDALPGVKYLRYVPNADHSLRGTDAPQSILACYEAILDGAPLPKFGWRLESDNAIRVTTEDRPSQVLLWQATNEKARDFRIETVGRKAWSSTPLAESAPGVYSAKCAVPANGWTAFFVELTFPSRGETPFKFTTQVRVVPDVLPFPPPTGRAGK
jgi:PhoPQ-activated pathogenicity-related protein